MPSRYLSLAGRPAGSDYYSPHVVIALHGDVMAGRCSTGGHAIAPELVTEDLTTAFRFTERSECGGSLHNMKRCGWNGGQAQSHPCSGMCALLSLLHTLAHTALHGQDPDQEQLQARYEGRLGGLGVGRSKGMTAQMS